MSYIRIVKRIRQDAFRKRAAFYFLMSKIIKIKLRFK